VSINQSFDDLEPQRNINTKKFITMTEESNSVFGPETPQIPNQRAPIKNANPTSEFSRKNYIELPEIYFRRKLWCTIVYGFCYFSFGCVVSTLGAILEFIRLDTKVESLILPLVLVARSIGYLFGCLLGAGPLSNFPRAGHLLICLSMFTMAIGLFIQPWILQFWLVALTWLFIGFGGGVLDTVINTILCRIWGTRVDVYMQAVHLASGIGASLAPIGISFAVQYLGTYRLSLWIISALLMLHAVVIIFVRVPFYETELSLTYARGASSPAEKSIIFFTAAFLLVSNGLEVSISGWLWIWTYARLQAIQQCHECNIVSFSTFLQLSVVMDSMQNGTTNIPTIAHPTLYPKENAFEILASYWAAYTLSRFLGVPLLSWTSPKTMVLIGLAGCGFSTIMLQVFPGSVSMTWIGTISLGLFISLLFPSAVSLPGNIGIEVNNRESLILLVGSSIGEICLPGLFGELYYAIGLHAVTWGCLAAFTLIFCLYLIILAVSSCSRTLARKRRSSDSEKRTLVAA